MTDQRKSGAEPDPTGALVCPRCKRPGPSLENHGPGDLARCPEHDLAYVQEAALAEASGDPMLGRTIAGRFVILSVLGAGSMGAVFRARQEAVGRDVALKIVRSERAYDPETKVRFEREARATSALSSPHTVTVFDFGEVEDGALFLAMEMLRGETLGQRLRREGYVDWPQAVRFAIHALRSLAEAHREGIVHRDLKPDNLFLMRGTDGDGETCKVLDFGIAKLEREDHKLDQLETQAGTVFGTPRYMSPEQAQGKALDARSDLYSLGVILFQMLAGRAPFIDDDAVVVMARHIKDPPPDFDGVAAGRAVPRALEQVVRRALAKEPAERVQSAEEFIRELEAVREASPRGYDSTTNTRALAPVSTTPPVSSRTFASRFGFMVVAAGVGLLGLLVVYAWRQTPDASRDAASPPLKAAAGQVAPAPALVSERTREATPTAEPSASVGAHPTPLRPRANPMVSVRVPSAGPATRPSASAPAPSTMEPKRPDERYGRFR